MSAISVNCESSTSIPVSTLAVTPHSQVRSDPVTINISVVEDKSGDPNRPYRLQVPQEDLYLCMAWTYENMMSWKLTPPFPAGVASAEFDQPAISFLTSPAVLAPFCTEDRTELRMPWTNVDDNIRPFGMSYFYRLHVVVTTTTGLRISVSHDPTVHNEPPNP
jgi:hypothetical protein